MSETVSLSERFSTFSFTPVSKEIASFSPVTASSEGSWSATSYYLDSSGRSSLIFPLQLGCRSKEDVDLIIASRCLQPAPKNIVTDNDEAQSPPTHSLRLEVQSYPSEESKAVTVEGITIRSCTVEGNSVLFDAEVNVRASAQPVVVETRTRDDQSIQPSRSGEYHPALVETRLEVTAVLVHRKKAAQQRPMASGLVALELGGGSLPISGVAKHSSNFHANQTRLGPFSINVSLTHALNISVKSVGGPSNGNTLVSLTMMHSNTHAEPVTVTNIALHPGHSRQDALFLKDRSMPGGERSVADMSKQVQWGYAPQTEPNLPLTLNPHDAYSTVLTVHATDELHSRTFASPISVIAVVGTGDHDTSRRPHVIVATDAQWTTVRVAVEPSDAFRIDMSLQESSCTVGTPVIVSLRVKNLGENSRDLMLLMAKEGDENEDVSSAIDSPAVSDVNGYTFGVWGLSGKDHGTSLHKRDHKLLAVDAAILLGEVKGDQSVDAEIRFVPLREGTLRIPDFRLYDRSEGKWYNCEHKLSLVAS